MLDDLARHGYSLHMLEVMLGIPYSTLWGYKSGAEPRYSDGEVLAKFYVGITKLEREQFPTVAVCYSAAKSK